MQRTRFSISSLIIFLLFSGSCLAEDYYEIEIIKSDRILLVKKGAEIEKEYFISTGLGGYGDKLRYGDRKTPVGQYRVVDFNEKSKFHLFMQLNYPNVKDAFWALKDDVISRYEFDRIIEAHKLSEIPPQDTELGGFIGLHGLGAVTPKKLHIHLNTDWTKGCIAMTNSEIKDLRHYVTIGTKVTISE